jgi:hypothetical protein
MKSDELKKGILETIIHTINHQPKFLGFVSPCSKIISFFLVEWQHHWSWHVRSAIHEVCDVSIKKKTLQVFID